MHGAARAVPPGCRQRQQSQLATHNGPNSECNAKPASIKAAGQRQAIKQTARGARTGMPHSASARRSTE